MSYLRDFGVKLEAMLQDLEPEKRKEVITLCKATVLESYRNGQQASGSQTPAKAAKE